MEPRLWGGGTPRPPAPPPPRPLLWPWERGPGGAPGPRGGADPPGPRPPPPSAGFVGVARGSRGTRADQGVRPTIAAGPLLFGYLLATGSYKFRVLDGCIGARGLAALSLLGARWRDCRQERGRHVGQFGFLFRGQRLDEVRGHHHQQVVGGFLGAAAAEDLAENGQIAQPGNLHQGFDHAVVDQTRDGEALAVLEDDLGFGAALGER